jgi:hypothetical protein
MRNSGKRLAASLFLAKTAIPWPLFANFCAFPQSADDFFPQMLYHQLREQQKKKSKKER